MKGKINNSSPELKGFKRAPSLGLSQWENGNLTTNLAETKDTNGAFLLVEAPIEHLHLQFGAFELATEYGIQFG